MDPGHRVPRVPPLRRNFRPLFFDPTMPRQAIARLNSMVYRRVEVAGTISLREYNGHKALDTDHGEASQGLG